MVEIKTTTIKDFDPQVRSVAISNINRKLQGKRITNFVRGEFSREAVKATQALLRENPNLRTRIFGSSGGKVIGVTEQKQRAKDLGFRNLQEARSVQALADKKRVRSNRTVKRIQRAVAPKKVRAPIRTDATRIGIDTNKFSNIKGDVNQTIAGQLSRGVVQKGIARSAAALNVTKKGIKFIEEDLGSPLTVGKFKEQLTKDLVKQLPKIRKDLVELQQKLSSTKGINKRRLQLLVNAKQKQIFNLETGKQAKVIAGDFPIIPAASIPSAITSIKFIGKQKFSKGKIVTDVLFRTSQGRVGVAKGLTVTKGTDGAASVILGRSGVQTFKLPGTASKIRKFETFLGRQVSKQETGTDLVRIADLGKAAKTGIFKKVSFKEAKSIGEVGVAKGKKLRFPVLTPKGIVEVRPKSLSLDQVKTLSRAITRGELTKIVGKSISGRKAKTLFVGLLKSPNNRGLSEALRGSGKTFSKLGGTQKTVQAKQFKKAFDDVASVVSKTVQSRQGKARIGTKTLLGAATLATTKPTIAEVSPRFVSSLSKPKKITQTGRLTTFFPDVKIDTKPIVEVAEKPGVITKQVPEVKISSGTKTETLVTPVTETTPAIKQVPALKTSTTQKLVTPTPVPPIINTGIRFDVPPPIIIKKPPKALLTKTKGVPIKKSAGYNSFAKAKGKFKKLNKVPITRTQALNLGGYIVDNSTSARFRIAKAGKKAQKPKLRIPRYTPKAFRDFKIKKGKKIKLVNEFIELRNKRINTIGEKRGLSVARALSKLKKRKRK